MIVGLLLNGKPIEKFYVKRNSITIDFLYRKFEELTDWNQGNYVLLRNGFLLNEVEIKTIKDKVENYFEINAIAKEIFFEDRKINKRKFDEISTKNSEYGDKKRRKTSFCKCKKVCKNNRCGCKRLGIKMRRKLYL